ncbi:hypothetical protein ES705_07081 [subsurface metagenome]
MVNIEEMLKEALFDSVVYCPYCEHGSLEPDYDKCPSCQKPNPLRKGGFI